MYEQGIASIAYTSLLVGLLYRKDRSMHVPFMAVGIGLDTLLVLVLQVQRGVIQGAVTDTYTTLQYLHIGSSTIAFVLYFPLVYFAVRQYRGIGSPQGRLWHIRIALTAFVFRTLGFGLMFSF